MKIDIVPFYDIFLSSGMFEYDPLVSVIDRLDRRLSDVTIAPDAELSDCAGCISAIIKRFS